MAKNKKRSFDAKDAAFLQSRRQFISQLSMITAAAGLATTTRLEFVEELAQKLIPQARAADVPLPQRMIFVGVRSGIPIMPLGAPSLFMQQSNALSPNIPFVGNQFTVGPNGLHFSPDALPLAAHADNLIISQGVASDGGHTSLFNFWQGGTGQGLTSPIITLAGRNTSSSTIAGVHFAQNANMNRVVAHRTNGETDLLTVHNNNFRDNFKKATLSFNDEAMDKILEASVKLSRRQALRMQASLGDAMSYPAQQSKASELLKIDYSAALDPSQMPAALNQGVNGTYRNFGLALAHTAKAMSLNLVNSATVELSIGDWHGQNTMTATRPHYQELAAKLAALVDYLKATPDLAGPTGTTLWDTTTIVVGSEFNRNDSTFGRDNGDGGAQGTLLLSKKAKGGYYGQVEYLNNAGLSGNPRIFRYAGVDKTTGQSMPSGVRNTTMELYHTINASVGNPKVASEVMTSYFQNPGDVA